MRALLNTLSVMIPLLLAVGAATTATAEPKVDFNSFPYHQGMHDHLQQVATGDLLKKRIHKQLLQNDVKIQEHLSLDSDYYNNNVKNDGGIVAGDLGALKQPAAGDEHLNDYLNTHHPMEEQAQAHVHVTTDACVAIFNKVRENLAADCYGDSAPKNPLFGRVYLTDSDAENAINTFKASRCYTVYTSDVLSLANRRCFPTVFVIQAALFGYFFGNSGTDGTSCALMYTRYNRMFHGCALFTPSQCTSTYPLCQAVATDHLANVQETGTNAGGMVSTTATASDGTTISQSTAVCESSFITLALEQICTGCLTGFVKMYHHLDPHSGTFTGFETLERALCSKAHSGELCYPLMWASLNAAKGQFASTNARMDTLCTASTVLGCYKRILLMLMADTRKTAKDSFVACSNKYLGNQTQVDSFCTPAFRASLGYVRAEGNTMRAMCIKSQAKGHYCAQQHYLVHSGTNGCYGKARVGAACSDCQTTLQTSLRNMGCCAGTIQEVYTGHGGLTYQDFPVTTNANYTRRADLTPTQGSPYGGYLQSLERCGVTGVNDSLRVKCAESASKISKTLRLKIVWESLDLDADLKERVQAALTTDVATNLGLSPVEVVDATMSQDISVRVTIADSRSGSTARTQKQDEEHRMDLEATKFGAKFVFHIRGADALTTTAASATFDQLQSSGEWVLPDTGDALESCAGSCTSSGDTTDLTEDESSSGAAQPLSSSLATVTAVTLVVLSMVAL